MTGQRTPDVLVLGVGGLAGEAWMSGFLAGLEAKTGADFTRADTNVGTSAGSMVAAALAAGVSPRRPETLHGLDEKPRPDRNSAVWHRVRWATVEAAYPFADAALRATAPGLALVRAAVLASLPAFRQPVDGLRRYIAGLGAGFDGRLRIIALDQANGNRVVFGAPGAPPASVVEAVAASCAVPGNYPPVPVAGRP